MALSKEYIDAAVARTAYPDAVAHSLSNYFEGLQEPVAVAISVTDQKYEDEINTVDRSLHPENIGKIVDLLRDKGIDAVSFMDPEASNPDKFVVNQSGVLCPFMSPEDSLKATLFIEDELMKNGYGPVGHVNPQSAQNMLYTAQASVNTKNGRVNSADNRIDLEQSHPDKEQFRQIEERNGGDYQSFIDRKVKEAYGAAETVNFDDIDRQNVYENGMSALYRGGTLGANPYAVVSQFNSRKVAHSSPAISICAEFCGKGRNMSNVGGAVYKNTSDGLEYGFIYKFDSMGDEQQFYHNVGLEIGDNAHTRDTANLGRRAPWNWLNGDIYESPVLPHHNKLRAIYMYVGAENEKEQKLYPIPLDENGKIKDAEWRDFMALHEPTDDKVLGYMKDRQDKQKKEQSDNPLHAYGFELKKGLEHDDQAYMETQSQRDFVRNFVHDGDLHEENGILSADDDLQLSDCHFNKFPDLSSVKVDGRVYLNNTAEEIDASKLPQATKGTVCLGVKLKNVSDLSAERFLGIAGAGIGKYGAIAFADEGNVYLECDGMPEGWDKIKFSSLPTGLSMQYDTIEKVPETMSGVDSSGVFIKDQSSIEKMPAADFIYKIKGNYGTDKYNRPDAYFIDHGIKHSDLNDDIALDLSHTNITVMPAEMKNLAVGKIFMNSSEKVTSLDNFPVTKEGIRNLNFEGSLKNETMESFLLKTKGSGWMERNTQKAADGHLVINGDFDFNTLKYSNDDKPAMNITSFPKDILNTEFRGDIEPRELKSNLRELQRLNNNKNESTLSISDQSSQPADLDLKDYKTADLDLRHYSGNLVLPSELKSLTVADSSDDVLSRIKEYPQTLQELNFLGDKFTKAPDLSAFDKQNIGISNCSFAKSPVFAQKTGDLSLRNTDFAAAVEIPAAPRFRAADVSFPEKSVFHLEDSREVSFENCKLPQGTVLDLSNCKDVTLENTDLSGVRVIMPKQAERVYIGENVKFPEDFRLDLSGCRSAALASDVKCAELKCPQKMQFPEGSRYIEIPSCVKEISTSCIASSIGIRQIPSEIRIIDTPDEKGKKVPLKILKRRGLSGQQVSALRKERIKDSVKSVIGKIIPVKTENRHAAAAKQPVHTTASDKEKIAQLSGRSMSRPHYAAETQKETPVRLYVKEEAPKTAVRAAEQPAATPHISEQPARTAPVAEKAAAEKSLPRKIADMSKKEFGRFVGKLRKGYNMLTGEGLDASAAKVNQSAEKTLQQTNSGNAAQSTQANVAAEMLKRNSGNSR